MKKAHSLMSGLFFVPICPSCSLMGDEVWQMIHEFLHPIPCTTPLGDGVVWYVTPNGFLENDELTVILNDGGLIKHFTTAQVKIWHNATYGIQKTANTANNEK